MVPSREGQPEYEKALGAAREELAVRLREKAQLDNRIAWLKATIATLEQVAAGNSQQRSISELFQTMLGYDPQAGLTDSVRYVLCNSGRPMSPMEIAHQLSLAGFDLSKYNNPSAVVHTTLRRLVASQEVKRVNVQGHKLYEWAGSPFTTSYVKE